MRRSSSHLVNAAERFSLSSCGRHLHRQQPALKLARRKLPPQTGPPLQLPPERAQSRTHFMRARIHRRAQSTIHHRRRRDRRDHHAGVGACASPRGCGRAGARAKADSGGGRRERALPAPARAGAAPSALVSTARPARHGSVPCRAMPQSRSAGARSALQAAADSGSAAASQRQRSGSASR
jgi:hypothetical protein